MSLRENKYSKNIKGLGGVGTAKIKKFQMGSGLQKYQRFGWDQDCIFV